MQFNKKYTLTTDCYHATEQKKNLIVLHFTAGSSAETAAQWFATRKDRVSTPYVIDRNGTIFELYDPKYWSFHLGIKGTHEHDKRSIGIEIANMGPLKLKGDTLCSWPNDYGQKYCTLDQHDLYVKAAYRSFDYYAAYTAAQFSAIAQLVQYLTARFNIPAQIPEQPFREQADLKYFANYQGIASHQNFRSDKTDVGPAFDWTIFNPIPAQAPPDPVYPVINKQNQIKEVSKWQTITESVKKVFNR